MVLKIVLVISVALSVGRMYSMICLAEHEQQRLRQRWMGYEMAINGCFTKADQAPNKRYEFFTPELGCLAVFDDRNRQVTTYLDLGRTEPMVVGYGAFTSVMCPAHRTEQQIVLDENLLEKHNSAEDKKRVKKDRGCCSVG